MILTSLKHIVLNVKNLKNENKSNKEGASLLQFLLSSIQCYCGLKKNARTKNENFYSYCIGDLEVRRMVSKALKSSGKGSVKEYDTSSNTNDSRSA